MAGMFNVQCGTSVGTHLVSFSRASLVLLGTALNRLAKGSPEAVFIAPAPLAHQAKHALAGSRCGQLVPVVLRWRMCNCSNGNRIRSNSTIALAP